jgi:hypothetical protein
LGDLNAILGSAWSKQTVSQLEHGQRQLDSGELVVLGMVLEVPVCELLTRQRRATKSR